MVHGNTSAELADAVTEALGEGWTLVGAPFFANDKFFQAIAK
jgi:hypothetical protein